MEFATFAAVLASVLGAGTWIGKRRSRPRLVPARVRVDRRPGADPDSPVGKRGCSW